MNWVDWIIVAIIIACAAHGLTSGTVKQAYILLRIILSVLLATAIHVIWLPPSLVASGEALLPAGGLYAVSLAVLYLVCWSALYLVFVLIKSVFPADTGLDFGQRIGGGFLGLVRGGTLVFLLLMLVDYSSWSATATWQESLLQAKLSPLAGEVRQGITLADDFTRARIELLLREWHDLQQQPLVSPQ